MKNTITKAILILVIGSSSIYASCITNHKLNEKLNNRYSLLKELKEKKVKIKEIIRVHNLAIDTCSTSAYSLMIQEVCKEMLMLNMSPEIDTQLSRITKRIKSLKEEINKIESHSTID